MGAAIGVVGAVTGVVGAISQNSAQQQQANAQRNALDQQSLTERNNTQLRLMELERQKNYSDFQYQIETARREISRTSDKNALQIAGLQDEQTKNVQSFGNQQSTIQQQTENQGLIGQANQEEFGAKSQAAGILSQEMEAGRGKSLELANQGAALNNEQIQQGFSQQQAFNQLAGQGQAGLSMSDNANLANMALINSTGVQEFLQQYGNVTDQIMQGGINAQTVADLVNQLGGDNAEFMRGTARRGDEFIQAAGAYNQNSIETASQLNKLGLTSAQEAQNSAYTIDEANSSLNRNYYDLQRQSQQSAITSSGNAVQTQINTQKSGIVQPNILGILGAGVSAYQAIAPTFSGKSISNYGKGK